MGWWGFSWRRGEGLPRRDESGPATSYGGRRGAHASGGEPVEQVEPEPGWNAPTDPLHGWPPVTAEKRWRAEGNSRWPLEDE